MKLAISSGGIVMAVAVLLVFMSSMAVVVTGRVLEPEAVACNPLELSSCLEPIRSGAEPSTTCCQKLKEQIPCFCEYLHNPALRQYVGGPNAKKLASACHVPYPHC